MNKKTRENIIGGIIFLLLNLVVYGCVLYSLATGYGF